MFLFFFIYCTVEDPCEPPPCDNGGTCTAINDNTDYECDCPDGFLGDNCEIGNKLYLFNRIPSVDMHQLYMYLQM